MKSRFACWMVAIAVICLPLLAGCTPPDVPRGTVSGKVTFKGKPLPGGAVVFVTEDGSKSERAEVKEDGTYSSSNVPMGKLKVGVEPAPKELGAVLPKGVLGKMKKPGAPEGAGGAAEPPPPPQHKGKYVDIPFLYRSPETSGWTLNLDTSPKPFDITIPDK